MTAHTATLNQNQRSLSKSKADCAASSMVGITSASRANSSSRRGSIAVVLLIRNGQDDWFLERKRQRLVLTRSIQGHGLRRLASEGLSNLTSQETDLLERLENYVAWAGRYPLPKSLPILDPEQLGVQLEDVWGRVHIMSNDRDAIVRLVHRIADLVNTPDVRKV